MKRVLGVALVLMLPAAFLVACGGDDSADSTSTTSKTSAEKSDSDSKDDSSSKDSGSGSSTGNAKVDRFCDDVTAVVEKSKKAIDDRDSDLGKEAADDAKALQDQAQELTSELSKDFSLAAPLAKCVGELGQAVGG